MVPAMSGRGQISIQPVNLNTIPRADEGSKAVLITQNWRDAALAGGTMATYNLLQQYQSGQFTNIQAVWIDNGTCYEPVTLTCLETGQVIRVPALAQGMYPIASGPAPVFTLTLLNTINVPAATTRLMFFNTAQRYVTQAVPPIATGQGIVSGSGFAGAATPLTVIQAALQLPASLNLYMALTGFILTLSMTAGAFVSNEPLTILLRLNGGDVWADIFNVSTSSFGAIYRTAVTFPAPITPQAHADVWTLLISDIQPGGTIIVEFVYFYDIVFLQ